MSNWFKMPKVLDERPPKEDARGVPDAGGGVYKVTAMPTPDEARVRLESWRDRKMGEILSVDHSYEHLVAALTVLALED
jgi:hypothetical protein